MSDDRQASRRSGGTVPLAHALRGVVLAFLLVFGCEFLVMMVLPSLAFGRASGAG